LKVTVKHQKMEAGRIWPNSPLPNNHVSTISHRIAVRWLNPVTAKYGLKPFFGISGTLHTSYISSCCANHTFCDPAWCGHR